MRWYWNTLFTVVALAAFSFCAQPVICEAGEADDGSKLRRLVEIERLPVDDEFRMKEGSEKDAYYGLIRSKEELEQVWSRLININKPYSSRMGFGMPEPPDIDFENCSVLWFSDRGAKASFVDTVLVAAYDSDRTLFVTFVAAHSDFASDRLNLWKVPLTGYRADFSVLHKYEE